MYVQALLDEANKKEEERLREEEKIWRALNANFPAPEDAPTEVRLKQSKYPYTVQSLYNAIFEVHVNGLEYK